MIDYNLALASGNFAALILVAASSYYILRSMLLRWPRQTQFEHWQSLLQTLVRRGRNIHPYIGGSIFLVFPWHGYTLWQQIPYGIKPLLGLAESLILLFMAITGLIIKHQPRWLVLRYLHRAGMFLAAFVLICHKLWPQ